MPAIRIRVARLVKIAPLVSSTFVLLVLVYSMQRPKETTTIPASSSDPSQNFLVGYVKDSETKLPLSGAKVEVLKTSATTNSDGKFVVPLPSGHYEISITKDGFKKEDKTIDLLKDSGGDFHFTLKKK